MRFHRGKLLVGNSEVGWKIGFGDGRGEIRYLAPEDMTEFKASSCGGTWSRADGFRVTVNYQVIDGIPQGMLEFSGNDGKTTPVEEIIFPCVRMKFDDATRILVPFSQGRLVNPKDYGENLAERINGRYRAFRFCAALFGSKGLYFDCRDSAFYNKNYRWSMEGDELIYESIFFLPLEHQDQYALPYRCGVTEFDGGWFEATRIYRPWALKQKWYTGADKEKNPLRHISMWAWNRGRIDYVMPPMERLAEDSGAPVALDWYWWHHNPYDTDYPDFWPPREGEEAFRKAVARMNAKGIYTQVYINGRTWDLDGPSYSEGGADAIEIKRDGTDLAVAFNSYNHHRLGYMCGEAPKFQQKMETLVSKLLDAGLPGVYLDMIGCTTGSCCYNPKHRHAPGGGTVNVDGYRAMMSRIRAAHPDRQFSTEDCAENWLDLFDSMIVLFSTSGERMGDSSDFVPAFSAIYHGANALFGSYALPDAIPPWDELWPSEDRFPAADEKDWNALYPCQFQLELARGVVWGMQPMICNFQMKHIEDPRFAEVYKFIVDTTRFHQKNVELLYSAEMVTPGTLECAKIDVDFLSRGIFTHKEHLRSISKKDQPAILHSVWKNPAGGRSLILANYTPQEQSFRFESISGTLPARSYRRIDLP